MLDLSKQPVLCTDAFNHIQCTLAPVEILFLIGQISLHDVVGGGVVDQSLTAFVEQIHTSLLDV